MAEAIKRLEERVARYITEAPFAEFPALKRMSADQIRQFGDRVLASCADRFAMEAANIIRIFCSGPKNTESFGLVINVPAFTSDETPLP